MGVSCASPAATEIDRCAPHGGLARDSERHLLCGQNGLSLALPAADFPKWQTVYHYFRLFRRDGLWATLNQLVREAVRQAEGRAPQASAMILDSQSAKSAEGGEKRG